MAVFIHRPSFASALLAIVCLFKPLAASSDGFIYVRNSDDLGFNSNVAVIDVTTQTIVDTIPLGGGSQGFIGIHPDNTTAWVTTFASSVFIIDLDSNTLKDELMIVGDTVRELAFNLNGQFAYIRELDPNFRIIARSTDKPSLNQESVTLSSPSVGGIAMHPDGAFAWACDNSAITVFNPNDPEDYDERYISVGGFTRDLIFNPAGTRAYITTDNDSMNPKEDVLVYNVQSETLVTTIDVGENPEGLVVSPDGSSLYVAVFGQLAQPFGDGGGIAIIDTASNTVTNFIDLPGSEQLAISGDGGLLFSTANDGVSFIDTQTETIVELVEFDQTGGLAFVDKPLYSDGFESE